MITSRRVVSVRAPLRISFAGGGTDLAAYYERFGGAVLSVAIKRYCRVSVAAPAREGIHLRSRDYDLCLSFDGAAPPPVEEPLSLARAAVERFWEGGLREVGAEISLSSEVPPGTGLGSSSAMTVALLRALSGYLSLPMSPGTLAETACSLEIERLGMPIGKQDQYASAFGGINMVYFTAGNVAVEPVTVPPETLHSLESRLLLFSTGCSRRSGDILRVQREKSKSDGTTIECLHRLKGLAVEMRETLLAADLDGFGRLLDRGWRFKKQLSARISSSAIDGWYDAALKVGALGGKITGAGGGGYLLLYCPPERQASVRRSLRKLGLKEMGFEFAMQGAEVVPPEPLERRQLDVAVEIRRRAHVGALVARRSEP